MMFAQMNVELHVKAVVWELAQILVLVVAAQLVVTCVIQHVKLLVQLLVVTIAILVVMAVLVILNLTPLAT